MKNSVKVTWLTRSPVVEIEEAGEVLFRIEGSWIRDIWDDTNLVQGEKVLEDVCHGFVEALRRVAEASRSKPTD